MTEVMDHETDQDSKPEDFVHIEIADDTVFDLLGGHFDMASGEVIMEVEVRELNGLDEEIITKSKSVGQTLQTVLERGTVRVGKEKANSDLLDRLLAGDRDWILLHIYAVTWGRTVKVSPYCAKCDSREEAEIDILAVPTRRLREPSEREFHVKLRNNGDAEVTMPTGNVQREMMVEGGKNIAELTTVLLANCVMSINGLPTMGEGSVRALSIPDRQTISEEIFNKEPKPLLLEITTPCKTCKTALEVPLSVADLFRL